MGASAAVAIIIRREKDLVAHFRSHGAIDAAHAMTPAALGVEQRMAWEILSRNAVIRDGASGTFYLDEVSWEAGQQRRRRMAVVMLVVVGRCSQWVRWLSRRRFRGSSTDQSDRSATSGSTFVARRAGIIDAAAATSSMKPPTAANVAGSVGASTPRQRRRDASECGRRDQADHQADSRKRQSLAEHHHQNALRARAKRHANADLASALRHGIGEDAVRADRGKEQRDRGKNAEQICEEAPGAMRRTLKILRPCAGTERSEAWDRGRRLCAGSAARAPLCRVSIARRCSYSPSRTLRCAASARNRDRARCRSSCRRRPASRLWRRRRS